MEIEAKFLADADLVERLSSAGKGGRLAGRGTKSAATGDRVL